MKISFLLALILISMSINVKANEGVKPSQAQVLGEGVSKSQADYVTLLINVVSQCYESPLPAQRATDEVVKEIDQHLEALKSEEDEHFRVVINGGYTAKYSRWDKNKELCANTFQKTTQINFSVGYSANFTEVFAELQNFVLQRFGLGAPLKSLAENPITYVAVGVPRPFLATKNFKTLEMQALSLAMVDATKKFFAMTNSCKSQDYKIKRIKEPQIAQVSRVPTFLRRRQEYSPEAVAGGGGVVEAPVRFDDIEIARKLEVTFLFDGSSCFGMQDVD